jgi:hypothetical protein
LAVSTTAEAAYSSSTGVTGQTPPSALVIFGASGDLTARKLLPALGRLAADGALAPEVTLIGVARSALTDDEFRSRCRQAMQASGPGVDQLIAAAQYVAGSYEDPATYAALEHLIAEKDQQRGTDGNRVYYLATPPQLFGSIAARLGAAGLDKSPTGGFVRLVIEKPFGRDGQSARQLYAEISSVFVEEQVFRIDHYLATLSPLPARTRHHDLARQGQLVGTRPTTPPIQPIRPPRGANRRRTTRPVSTATGVDILRSPHGSFSTCRLFGITGRALAAAGAYLTAFGDLVVLKTSHAARQALRERCRRRLSGHTPQRQRLTRPDACPAKSAISPAES